MDTKNHNTFPNCLWNYWQPRLAVWALLQADPGNCFALIAVVCTSWCHINSGTHRRSLLFPEGRTELGYVRSGNEMMSRILVGQSFIYIYMYIVCVAYFSQNFWCRTQNNYQVQPEFFGHMYGHIQLYSLYPCISIYTYRTYNMC